MRDSLRIIRHRSLRSIKHNTYDTAGSFPCVVPYGLWFVGIILLESLPSLLCICCEPLERLNHGSLTQTQEAKVWAA